MISESRSVLWRRTGLHVACRTPTYTMRDAHRVFCNALVYWPKRFVKEMTTQPTRMLENDVMPKVLVLVAGDSDSSKSLAESVRDGAAEVRFTEVDVRRVTSREATDLRDYDGIVVVGSGRDVSPALASLIEPGDLTDATAFRNTVLASAGFDGGAILERLARLGGIIVAERPSDLAPDARAVLVGTRVAKVAGWVRHALSHEHGHR